MSELIKASLVETLDYCLEIKEGSVTDDGEFRGYASLFGGEADDYRDVIAPGAFHASLKAGGRNGNGIAMLWQHSPEFPIGVWLSVQEDAKGLAVIGSIDKNVAPMGIPLYSMLKKGAVKGMSIGFRTILSERDEKTGIRTLKEIELWEISLVTFPASKRAQVTNVKDIEAARTPRELEKALREAGLSASSAKYMVSISKHGIGERDVQQKVSMDVLLAELKDVNLSLDIFNLSIK